MIKWFFKYGAVFFLLNTILLSVKQTVVIGEFVFLGVMGVFSFLVLINPPQIKNIIFHKSLRFFLILNGLNIFYFILFHNINDFEAAKYLIARGMQFSLISFSVYHNYEYFKSKFMEHIVYSIAILVFIGFLINPSIFSGRYSGIVWNPNMLASFSCIGFSALLLNSKPKTNFDIFLLSVFLIISLLTGSRGVLVGISLAFFFRFGFSSRNVIYALISIFIFIISISFQLDTSFNRFSSQGLFNDRMLQYTYAFETFIQKPFFGYGLDKYAYIDKSIVPAFLDGLIISAHNGYLAILVQYGIFFSIVIFGIIFYKTGKSIKYFRNGRSLPNFYLYSLIYALFAAFYETLITGINEFHTILFWISLAMLSFTEFKLNNES